MSITSGRVSIEDGTKAKEEYAPARKVVVELHFEVPEGGDSQMFLDTTALVADNKVRALLGRPEVQTAAQPAPAPKTTKKTPAETGKTKADLAKEVGLPATDTQHKGTTAPLVDADELDAPPATKTAAVPAAEEDALGGLLDETTAPTPISDKELGSVATKWVAEQKEKHKDKFVPTIIREFIAEYAGGPGKPMSAIPQAKRPEFVEKLTTLKGVK